MTRKSAGRIRKDRKLPTPKAATIENYLADRVRDIQRAFLVPSAVTIVIRLGPTPEEEIVVGNDHLPTVIAAMQVKAEALAASQAQEAARAAAELEPPAVASAEAPEAAQDALGDE